MDLPNSPSTHTPRQRRRAERIDSIREVALEIILEDGIDSFSIHRLADRLDLTVGALYRYFDSVDHLLSAVQVDVLEFFDLYLEAVEETFGPNQRTELDGVVNLCHAYMALNVISPQRFRLIAKFVSSLDPMLNDEAAQNSVAPSIRLLGRLGNALLKSEEAGELHEGDAFERAVLLWSSIQGIQERKKLARLNPDFFNVERLGRSLITTMLMGWGASKEAAEAAVEEAQSDSSFKRVLDTLA